MAIFQFELFFSVLERLAGIMRVRGKQLIRVNIISLPIRRKTPTRHKITVLRSTIGRVHAAINDLCSRQVSILANLDSTAGGVELLIVCFLNRRRNL